LGKLNQYKNKTIFLDTAPIIYFIEKNEKFYDVLEELFNGLTKGDFQTISSSLTLHEVLVQPYRLDKKELVYQYKEILLNSKGIMILPFTNEIADISARIRANYNFSTPDSIQISTALFGHAKIFLTNDKDLKKIKDIEIVLLDDLV
jgi:predicted nucleic acid-binding protein